MRGEVHWLRFLLGCSVGLILAGTEHTPVRGVVVRGLTVDANCWHQQAKQPRGIECKWATHVSFDKVAVRRARVSLALLWGLAEAGRMRPSCLR